jgi:very-short-patch-repair endonuclease
MTTIGELVQSLGGMAQKQQLVRLGARDFHLTAAVRCGDVIRARNGWYSTMSEKDPRLRAVRVGGRLTGISALIERGAWVLGEYPLHVSVHDNAARLRTQRNRYKRLDVAAPRGVELHWDDRNVRNSGTATSVGLLDALVRVVLDESLETAVAVLDWATHTGELDEIDFERLILKLPAERRGIAKFVDPKCESLPESLARTRLLLAGHEVEPQVRLGDVQRIDLVVDGAVALEVDGEEHHRDRFEYDRDKDIDITISHKHAIRPSARAVFHRWDRVALAIDTALADRGLHFGNSGNRARDAYGSRGITGWRKMRRSRNPEFPKWGSGNGGNTGARGAGYNFRE